MRRDTGAPAGRSRKQPPRPARQFSLQEAALKPQRSRLSVRRSFAVQAAVIANPHRLRGGGRRTAVKNGGPFAAFFQAAQGAASLRSSAFRRPCRRLRLRSAQSPGSAGCQHDPSLAPLPLRVAEMRPEAEETRGNSSPAVPRTMMPSVDCRPAELHNTRGIRMSVTDPHCS